MFTAEGTFRGEPARLTWDDGQVEGTLALKAEVLIANDVERHVGPVGGPYTHGRGKHLASPLSALMLIRSLLQDATYTGDVPEVPELAAGELA